jgi:hypothetical protein
MRPPPADRHCRRRFGINSRQCKSRQRIFATPAESSALPPREFQSRSSPPRSSKCIRASFVKTTRYSPDRALLSRARRWHTHFMRPRERNGIVGRCPIRIGDPDRMSSRARPSLHHRDRPPHACLRCSTPREFTRHLKQDEVSAAGFFGEGLRTSLPDCRAHPPASKHDTPSSTEPIVSWLA